MQSLTFHFQILEEKNKNIDNSFQFHSFERGISFSWLKHSDYQGGGWQKQNKNKQTNKAERRKPINGKASGRKWTKLPTSFLSLIVLKLQRSRWSTTSFTWMLGYKFGVSQRGLKSLFFFFSFFFFFFFFRILMFSSVGNQDLHFFSLAESWNSVDLHETKISWQHHKLNWPNSLLVWPKQFTENLVN